jgi:alpha-amylase/alpha-mannosidase (GH57 family)
MKNRPTSSPQKPHEKPAGQSHPGSHSHAAAGAPPPVVKEPERRPHPHAGVYLVIHGHFYQPPRENPWLGTVDRQPSAAPHHDWNERIAAQCYGPNRSSRILDGSGRIEELVSNYERISFNFGPTLLSWLASQPSPTTYHALRAADAVSARRLEGHGNALSQVYNHVIMPLADPLDRRTQVLWGKADFAFHYGRQPEGMWLAETAFDLATARELVAAGVRFTVLSPLQALRARAIGRSEWVDVSSGNIDTTRAYRVFPFPQDRTRHLDVLFYDAGVSRAVAFEHLLRNADLLASRLLDGAPHDSDRPYLVNIATDGESYGHHEPFGDMCLAYLFNRRLTSSRARLSNYAHFLSLAEPEYEVEIKEPSAWSCSHGVGRWERDCGCNAGTAGFNQKWRRPLREGLDHLREELRTVFVHETSRFFDDPWNARDSYIGVILGGHTPEARETFFRTSGCKAESDQDRARLLRLMESQRNAMLMYTSCGWFFDDLSGIEPVQNLSYALRAIELAQPCSRRDLRAVLETYLRKATSNHRGQDGTHVLEENAAAPRRSAAQLAAGYALEAVLVPEPERLQYPEWRPVSIEMAPPIEPFGVHMVGERGAWKRALPGHVGVRELCTGEVRQFEVLVLQGDDLSVSCLVVPSKRDENGFGERLRGASLAERATMLAGRFGKGHYRLSEIPPETAERVRRRVLAQALAPLAARLESELLEYESMLVLMREEGRQPPPLLMSLARAVTEERLAEISRSVGPLDSEEFLDRVEETYLLGGLAGMKPDPSPIREPLSRLFLDLVRQAAHAWREGPPSRIALLDNRIRALLSLAEARAIDLDRTAAEETLYFALRDSGPRMQRALAGEGDERRAAELMQALALRVNLAPQVLKPRRGTRHAEASKKG